MLGDNDLLIQWQKPTRDQTSSYSLQQWQALPEYLTLRQIKVEINQPGFRGSVFYIVTTLLDPEQYPVKRIEDLYRQRWDVELFFRDIKTTLGTDILRCKTPDMVRKEIVMHWIVYNCIRWLMMTASNPDKSPARQLSFKGSLQALRHWEPMLYQLKNSPAQQRQLLEQLRHVIATKWVAQRPDRSEPRAVKRRPKSYQLMTRPRGLMTEVAHRGKYGAEGA